MPAIASAVFVKKGKGCWRQGACYVHMCSNLFVCVRSYPCKCCSNAQTSASVISLEVIFLDVLGMGHLGNLYLYRLLGRGCCLIQLEFLQHLWRVWKNILIVGLYMCFIWIRILKSFGSIHLIQSLRQRYVVLLSMDFFIWFGQNIFPSI